MRDAFGCAARAWGLSAIYQAAMRLASERNKIFFGWWTAQAQPTLESLIEVLG